MHSSSSPFRLPVNDSLLILLTNTLASEKRKGSGKKRDDFVVREVAAVNTIKRHRILARHTSNSEGMETASRVIVRDVCGLYKGMIRNGKANLPIHLIFARLFEAFQE